MSRAQPAGHPKSVYLGQHHIQNDQIILAGQAIINAIRSVAYHVRLIALVLHKLPQRLSQPRLVFHN